MGLKAEGDESHGVHDAPQPFTVSTAVLHQTWPSKTGLSERTRAHWVGKHGWV
jgi:hypothetical protein